MRDHKNQLEPVWQSFPEIYAIIDFMLCVINQKLTEIKNKPETHLKSEINHQIYFNYHIFNKS